MLYDCKTNNQSQKRCTMDSLKETDKPAPNPSKRPHIEADEEMTCRTDRRTGPFGLESRPQDSRAERRRRRNDSGAYAKIRDRRIVSVGRPYRCGCGERCIRISS